MSISSSITGNIYRAVAQTTPDAQTQAKADRKKARQEKRQRKAEGVMGAIGSFAESVAAGLEAEGQRRTKLGLSGAGFAAAFSSGASEIIDFGRLQKAKRKSALTQKLGFTPADAGSDDDIQKIIDALTEYEASQNAGVGVTDATADGDKADEQSTGDKPDSEAQSEKKPDPLEMPEEPTQSEAPPTEAETQAAMERARAMMGVEEAAEALDAKVKPVDLGHPVLNNIITYPDASTLGSRIFDDLFRQVGIPVEDENNNGIPDILENN
jgi:hypothetical protein